MKDPIQEQLVLARRNQILEAAAKVFADKGFHPTTIKDIAREAGIADGTIYNYFENKTALLLGILDAMRQSARQEVDFSQLREGDFRNFLRVYFRQPLIVPAADNFALFRVVISEVMVNPSFRELYYQKVLEPTVEMAQRFFQEWAARHAIKPLDMALTTRVISGLIMGLIVERIAGDQALQAHWDELPDFLTDLILDGIRSR